MLVDKLLGQEVVIKMLVDVARLDPTFLTLFFEWNVLVGEARFETLAGPEGVFIFLEWLILKESWFYLSYHCSIPLYLPFPELGLVISLPLLSLLHVLLDLFRLHHTGRLNQLLKSPGLLTTLSFEVYWLQRDGLF